MALILHLETATRMCSVALSSDGNVLAFREINEGNTHSEKLTVFAQQIMEEAGYKLTDLDAVAVSKGPGSYTGLRIGVSTAKGLCYGLGVPLISISTLQSMAIGAKEKMADLGAQSTRFAPMIDARRMEVYTCFFDEQIEPTTAISAEIIDEESFANELALHRMVFFGNGAEKCKAVFESNSNAVFLDDMHPSARYMPELAEKAFAAGNFEDVAYFEPYYLKDFVAGKPKKLV